MTAGEIRRYLILAGSGAVGLAAWMVLATMVRWGLT
jgi:hypothetical protein